MSNDDWMAGLPAFKLAEIAQETADYARITELLEGISDELVTIAERLNPRAPAMVFDRMLYKLGNVLYADAELRGLYAPMTDDELQRVVVAPRMELSRSTETAVYRAFSAGGVLLYVGITQAPQTRMRGHERTSEWWDEMQSVTFEWCTSRADALALERELVSTLRPPFNTSMNPEAAR